MAAPTLSMYVTRKELITPHMMRVFFGGGDYELFTPNNMADAYVHFLFPRDGRPLPDGFDFMTSRSELPAEKLPMIRTYTVRAIDEEKKEIAFDYVLHGDEGHAGRWAVAVEPGEKVFFYGPGGRYNPSSEADWHLFVGDESALPAIMNGIEALPSWAQAFAVIEIAGPEDRQDIRHDGVTVTWIYHEDRSGLSLEDVDPAQSPLLAHIKEMEWLPGRVQVFVHGEAELTMRHLRPFLIKERQIDKKLMSISAYWRRGQSEDGFRIWKQSQKNILPMP